MFAKNACFCWELVLPFRVLFSAICLFAFLRSCCIIISRTKCSNLTFKPDKHTLREYSEVNFLDFNLLYVFFALVLLSFEATKNMCVTTVATR